MMRSERDCAEQKHDGQQGHYLRGPKPPAKQREEGRRDDDAPDDRRRLEECEPREGRDPEQTTQDVEAVGGEGRERGKGARHPLGDQRHGCGDEHEDERQADPDRQSGRPEDPNQAGAVADLDREESDETQEDRQDDRCLPEVISPRARPQEADADAEKARQQHEVGEVGEIQNVGSAPADQHELEEEHQEAEEQQPELPAAIVR